MTLSQYLRVARTNWLLIAALTALGALGAAAYAWAQTPMYSATAQMFVSTTSNESDALAQLTQGNLFTQQRVKSYAAIITAPDVLNPVIKQLKLPYASPTELSSHVSASSPLDTVLLDVKVTDTVPERARDTANAVAAQFTDYVGRLELPSGKGTSPVKVTVTAPAVAATAPDSPKKMLDLALGLLVGLGLGIGLSVLRDSLDRTIGAHHDPGELTGAPVLAGMSDDPSVKDAPLIVHDPFAARAEAFRQLRTNIRYLSVDQEVRALVITSSVAGEGKTTTAANLAIAMAQGGENVVLIDADLRRPSIAELFGLPSGVGLTTVLVGDVPVEDAVQTWRDDLNLSVLTSGPLPPNPSELIGSHRMAELITQLTGVGFMVVVDSPPLLPVTDAAVLARLTGGALVVTRIGSTRIEQLGAAVEALRTAGATVLGVVANRLPRRRGAGGYPYRYGYGSTETYAPATAVVEAPSSPRPATATAVRKRRTAATAAVGKRRTTPETPVAFPPPPAAIPQQAPQQIPQPVPQAAAQPAFPQAAAQPAFPQPARPAAAAPQPPAPQPPAPRPPASLSPAAAPPAAAAAVAAPHPAAPTTTTRSVADVLSPTGEAAPRAVNVLAAKGSRLFSRSKKGATAPAASVVVAPPPIGPPPVASPDAAPAATATVDAAPVAAPPMVSATPVFAPPPVEHPPAPRPAEHDEPAGHALPAGAEPSFDALVEASLRAVIRAEAVPAAPIDPQPIPVMPIDAMQAPAVSIPAVSIPADSIPADSFPAMPAHIESTQAEPVHAEPVHAEPVHAEPIHEVPSYEASPALKYPFGATSTDSDDLYAGTIYSLDDEVARPRTTPVPAAPHGHWTTTELEDDRGDAHFDDQSVDHLDDRPGHLDQPGDHLADQPGDNLDDQPGDGEHTDDRLGAQPFGSRGAPTPEPPNPMFTPRPPTAASGTPMPPAARRPAAELPPIWSPKPAETPSRPANLPLTSGSASPTALPTAGAVMPATTAFVLPAEGRSLTAKHGAPLAAVSTVTMAPATVLDIDAAHELDTAHQKNAVPQQGSAGTAEQWAATADSWSVDFSRPQAHPVATVTLPDDDQPSLTDQPADQADAAPAQGFLALRTPRGSEPRTAEDRATEMRAAAMREAAARVAAQREAQREAQQEAEEARALAHHGWPIEQRSDSPATTADGWPFPSPTATNATPGTSATGTGTGTPFAAPAGAPAETPSSPAVWAAEPWPGPDVHPPQPSGLDDLFGEPHPERTTRRDGGGWRPSRRR